MQLTRYDDEDVLRLLEREADGLNKLEPGEPGDVLVSTIRRRLRHANDMARIRALVSSSNSQQAELGKAVLGGLQDEHVLMAGNIIWMMTMAIDDPEVRKGLFGSLRKIAAGARRHAREWDTYSSAAYHLDLVVRMQRNDPDARTLSEPECREIEACIAPVLKGAVGGPGRELQRSGGRD